MVEKEYIERNAVVNGLRAAIKKYSDDKSEANIITALIFQRFAKEIEAIPAADVEPVRHGHWYNRGGRFRCSVCDNKALLKDIGGTGGWSHEYEQQKSPYCPNCGAKMDDNEVE